MRVEGSAQRPCNRHFIHLDLSHLEGLHESDGFERITGREHEELVEKCQENGWLKVGGFDWQDDPFLEEYPYEFSRTDSVDRLREALGSGLSLNPKAPRAPKAAMAIELLAEKRVQLENGEIDAAEYEDWKASL